MFLVGLVPAMAGAKTPVEHGDPSVAVDPSGPITPAFGGQFLEDGRFSSNTVGTTAVASQLSSDQSQVVFTDRFEAFPARTSTWQPWEWRGYEMFPSLYFAAEPEGYLSNEQMAKISQFSLAILEFRMGQFVEETTTGLWAGGDLAGFMTEQVRRFKERHPNGPPMLVYRSGMWAGSMYSAQWDALQNQSLFVEDSRDCQGFIDYPRDVDESGDSTGLSYCRWDFRKDEARAVFADIMDPKNIGMADGVFFDNAMSVACDEAKHLSQMTREERSVFLDEQLASYASVFSRLVESNRYPILSTTVGFSSIGAQVPWENDCPSGEEAVLKALKGIPFARNQEFWMWNLGDTAARQIQNTIQETRNGIPAIVHMGYFSNDGGCAEGCIQLDGTSKAFSKNEFLEFGIAAFLVSMGPGSYFGFSDMQNDPEGGGWFDVSWDHHPQYNTVVTGQPVGDVEVSQNGMVFTRRFENGTVWVNAADGTYQINLVSTR